MTQYINKDALVAEIERKHDCPYYDENAPVCDDGDCGCYECYRRIEKLKSQKEENI